MQSSQGTALQCAVLGDQSTCDNRRQCMFLHPKTFFAARSREGTALLYFFFFSFCAGSYHFLSSPDMLSKHLHWSINKSI